LRRLLIWDTAQMVVAEKKKVSDIIPQKATFRPNGKQIAICGEKILKFYDLNSGKVQSLKFHFLLTRDQRTASCRSSAQLDRTGRKNLKNSDRINSIKPIKLENLGPDS